MGHEFGNLIWIKHIISYSLSPFQQRAFPNYFLKGISNMTRWMQDSILCVTSPLLPFIGFYLLYNWGTQEFENSKKKSPDAFEKDKSTTQRELQ
uniref:Cytochrome b-c1 complex subunit 8 n=1 Tax=Monodelphis domestica TaxID=13616 RepID=A0A5F8G2B7_MONDO